MSRKYQIKLTGEFCAEAANGDLIKGADIEAVHGASIDTRTAKAGQVFIAISGPNFDGHQFMGEAIAKDCVGLVVNNEFISRAVAASGEAPDRVFVVAVENTVKALGMIANAWIHVLGPKVVAVTGSVGKTTTKELLAECMKTRYVTLATVGNLNNHIGLPLTALSLKPEHEAVVFEMGMNHAGEIAHLCKIARPQIGVVTYVGPVHLEGLGSIAAIADAKSELISALPKNGVAVLNADNPHVIAMAQRAPCPVMTFGFDANATVRIVDAQIDERGLLTLSLQYKDEIIPVATFLVGLHNAANVAAAVTAAIAAGVPFDKACNAIGLVTPSSHRLAVIQANHFRIIDDCYNASPPSMAAALQVLAQNQGRKVAILGDMLELGAATDVAHLELGSLVAAKKIDVLIAVGKYSDRIVLGAKDSQGFEAEVYKVDDAIQAAKIAEVVVTKGDTVLVKGSRGVGLDIVVKALESLSGREELSN